MTVEVSMLAADSWGLDSVWLVVYKKNKFCTVMNAQEQHKVISAHHFCSKYFGGFWGLQKCADLYSVPVSYLIHWPYVRPHKECMCAQSCKQETFASNIYSTQIDVNRDLMNGKPSSIAPPIT